MKRKRIRRLLSGILFAISICPTCSRGQGKQLHPEQKIFIEWNMGAPSGSIEVLHGRLMKIEIIKGRGKVTKDRFAFTSAGPYRLLLEIDSAHTSPGPGSTIVSVKSGKNPFSFLLRDVSKSFPIYIPDFSVVVLEGADNRSYAEVQRNIQSLGLQSKLQKIEAAPEASFASVENRVLKQSVPTWLGISRDMRIFQLEESTPALPLTSNVITPLNSSSSIRLAETNNEAVSYSYNIGRGVGPELNNARRLEEGVLPIVHSIQTDDDIKYDCTSFVSLERSALTPENVKGTDFLVADRYSGGHMFTEEQKALLKPRLEEASSATEETVFFFKAEVTNNGKVPRYAWFKTPEPGRSWGQNYAYRFDPATGYSSYSEDRIFCISLLNGKPLPNEEIAVLLQPGEKADFAFFLPHMPISSARAQELAQRSFDQIHGECRQFWTGKLDKAAHIHVPEKRIDEMIRAGLLHLDLITFGKEPQGTLAPNIGVYSPIGTESAPIIQFYNSIAWQDIAKRSLTYFLDKQHANGFMQNFGGYMVETGAVLWSLGEYFRYTRDREWVKEIEAKVLKSCDFLLQWRTENKIDSLRGRGYGMIAGKVADPEDNFHQFMLNGYGYLGLSRIAEMLATIDPVQSGRLRKEADAWKKDIRESFFNGMALSPVVPLGDGTWCPTAPPWTEARGPRALFLNPESFFSHGTFTVPDAMLGPLYLVFCEVLDVDEPASRMMLSYHRELFYQNNSAFSQPYYSRHNWMQARLEETKPFLNTYYSTMAAHADRETYTFWEHLYHESPHKTHEEAWFLMQTRWMLYMEDGSTLRLLNTIPRKWMEDGKTIELDGVQSYFGPLNVKVSSSVAKNYIEATIRCDSDRKPREVVIRLPHPDGKKAVKAAGGEYNPDKETLTISSFNGNAHVRLEY